MFTGARIPLAIFTALLALPLVLTNSGCGGGDDEDGGEGPAATAEKDGETTAGDTLAGIQANLESAGYTVTVVPEDTLGDLTGAEGETIPAAGALEIYGDEGGALVYDIPDSGARSAYVQFQDDLGNAYIEEGSLVYQSVAGSLSKAQLQDVVDAAQGG